jgi:anti-sigma regulatory factor (Ser/Thr protein kinase)
MTETSSDFALRVQVAARPDEIPRVRQAVRDWLRSAGNRCDWFAAELVLCELVTNALRHALPPLEVRVQPLGSAGVRIEVYDASADRLPVRDRAPLEAEGGRGIEIVASLASRWGIESSDSRKMVWAEVG